MRDKVSDASHPRKRNRPVASGKIGEKQALWLAFGLLLLAAAVVAPLGLTGGVEAAGVLGGYLVVNLLYCYKLREVPVVDVASIASGFVLRVIGGSVIIGIFPTFWLLSSTFFLALMLGYGKRLAEERRSHGAGREVLSRYPPGSLSVLVKGSRWLLVGCYAAYTIFSKDAPLLWITIAPAVVGTSRYLYLSQNGLEAEAPEWILLKDRAIQTSLFVWGVLFAFVTYGKMLEKVF